MLWTNLPCRDISVLQSDKPFYHTLHTFCSCFILCKNTRQIQYTFETITKVSGAGLKNYWGLPATTTGTPRQHPLDSNKSYHNTTTRTTGVRLNRCENKIKRIRQTRQTTWKLSQPNRTGGGVRLPDNTTHSKQLETAFGTALAPVTACRLLMI